MGRAVQDDQRYDRHHNNVKARQEAGIGDVGRQKADLLGGGGPKEGKADGQKYEFLAARHGAGGAGAFTQGKGQDHCCCDNEAHADKPQRPHRLHGRRLGYEATTPDGGGNEQNEIGLYAGHSMHS